MNWQPTAIRVAYLCVGVAGGFALSLLRPPEERVEYRLVDRVRKEVQVEYKDREQIKWKERIVEKPCGIRIIERSGTSDRQVEERTEQTEEVERTETLIQTKPSLSRYRIGLQADWKAAIVPADLTNWRTSFSMRLGGMPLFVGVWADGAPTFGLQIDWEF